MHMCMEGIQSPPSSITFLLIMWFSAFKKPISKFCNENVNMKHRSNDNIFMYCFRSLRSAKLRLMQNCVMCILEDI